MVVTLEGGCRVSALREGRPESRGTLRSWSRAGRESGALAISLRILELSPGCSPGIRNEACDEVLYTLAGRAMIRIDGHPYEVSRDVGLYLAPGSTLCVENPGPDALVLASSRCPDPADAPWLVDPVTGPRGEPPTPAPLVRLADRASETTMDRWYRTLVGEEQGSARVTQFVGSIPPGRAPEHFHRYEEVLCILRGSGKMWAGESCTAVEAGSCIFLPREQVHCLENTGTGELRVLGVFFPAGSPAAAYEPE